jgi:hypothetical protein
VEGNRSVAEGGPVVMLCEVIDELLVFFLKNKRIRSTYRFICTKPMTPSTLFSEANPSRV